MDPNKRTSGNPKFDKALTDMLGEDVAKTLYCSDCGKDLIECPKCHEMLCPKGCDYEKA